jgi:hypothetical protein
VEAIVVIEGIITPMEETGLGIVSSLLKARSSSSYSIEI